jgi:hypothetical protein
MHFKEHSLSVHETGQSSDSHSRAYSIDTEQTLSLLIVVRVTESKQRGPNPNKQPQRGIPIKILRGIKTQTGARLQENEASPQLFPCSPPVLVVIPSAQLAWLSPPV